MANKPDYDVVARLAPKKGEEKSQWRKIGAVWSGDHGLSGRIENIPIGWDGGFILAEPKPKDAAPKKDDSGLPKDVDNDLPW